MNTEVFEWYIELLEKGEVIHVNPHNYGDFLKYVCFVGKEGKFSRQMLRTFKAPVVVDGYEHKEPEIKLSLMPDLPSWFTK